MTSLVLGQHFEHFVANEISGFNNDVIGKLYLSQSGYVYQHQSRAVLWIKFLGLGISLPIKAVLNKIWQAVLYVFDGDVPSKGAYDLSHLFYLSGVAWKGVVGWKKPLFERASEFALKEIDYHYQNREDAMNASRSERLTSGYYTAPCMHPLFQGNDYNENPQAAQQYTHKQRELKGLKHEQVKRQEASGLFSGYFRGYIQDTHSPYQSMSDEQLNRRILQLEAELTRPLNLDGRVKRYADIAVVKQHGCLRAKAAANNALTSTTETITSALVEETNRVDCCGKTCYQRNAFVAVFIR